MHNYLQKLKKMMNVEKTSPELWGEMEDDPMMEDKVDETEHEAIMKTINDFRAIDVEGTTMYFGPQPSVQPEVEMSDGMQCEIIKHTIRLKLYSQKMQELIDEVKKQLVRGQVDLDEISPPPPMPELAEECVLLYRQPGDITGRDRNSDFVKGIGVSPPLVTKEHIRNMQERAISAIFCQTGFDSSTANTMDILVDIQQEFFKRMTKLLRRNNDRKALTGDNVFIDVIEQTFHEIGFESVVGLHQFYQDTVVKRYEHMRLECEKVLEEYTHLVAAASLAMDGSPPEKKPKRSYKTKKEKER